MLLYLIPALLVSFPILLAALALKSLLLLIVGSGFGILYLLFFLVNSFSEFLHELRAISVEDHQNIRLQKLWSEAGPERVAARFWVYPSSDAQFKVWVKNEKTLEIFLSQGLLQLATDSGLKAAFQSMVSLSFADVRKQNRLHALMGRFDRLKGPKEDFRYWLISFWLYPLERLLKIARL